MPKDSYLQAIFTTPKYRIQIVWNFAVVKLWENKKIKRNIFFVAIVSIAFWVCEFKGFTQI